MTLSKCLVLLFLIFFNKRFACAKDVNGFLFGAKDNFEFVDLTQNLEGQNSYLLKAHSWYSSGHPCTDERSGTHIDSKYYNPSKGEFVDQIPLEKLIVPLMIADISDKVNSNADFVLYKHHLDYFLNNYFGNTNQPCIIVFKFGWSTYFSDQRKYYGIDENGSQHFPGLSEEVAQWITSFYKNIVGVGVDLPSVDPGFTNQTTVHKILTKSGLYVIQNIKLDKFVPDYWCTAIILPLKIKKGLSSSPLRLVGICPRSQMLPSNYALHHL